MMIDQMINVYQNASPKIIESESTIEDLKNENISKKEL